MDPKERIHALLEYGKLLLQAKANEHKVTTELQKCINALQTELIETK